MLKNAVLGHFTFVDDMVEAAETLRNSDCGVTVFSPIPLHHETNPVLGEKPNHIKYITLLGAIGGIVFGILLTLGTAALYTLPRGGRPIWSITPTLLITYELTILIGVVFTLLAFFFFAKLPAIKKRFYDEKVAVDSFGLLVHDVHMDRLDEVEAVLKEYGANEVKRVENT